MDVVHSAGGLGVVMEYLLGSSSPRLQYEAVRLLTVWAAQDANRMAFQEMGGIQRLEQVPTHFHSVGCVYAVPWLTHCFPCAGIGYVPELARAQRRADHVHPDCTQHHEHSAYAPYPRC